MNDKHPRPGNKRSYPGSYDKLIPIALVSIAVAIVEVLAFALFVVSLWGILARRSWATNLVISLDR